MTVGKKKKKKNNVMSENKEKADATTKFAMFDLEHTKQSIWKQKAKYQVCRCIQITKTDYKRKRVYKLTTELV
jgi:hypothetical protein